MKMLYFDEMISVYYILTVYMLNLDNGWLYLATGFMLVSLKRFPVEIYLSNRFSRFILYILTRFTSIKINGTVVCLSFAVNLVMFANVNADEFTPSKWFVFFNVLHEMLCTKHIIVFSLGISFPIVGSGTIPHQTTL